MVFNKKKVKEKPLAELQRLQSELETLRAKQLATLEKQLQAIEKSVETQKAKTENYNDIEKYLKLSAEEIRTHLGLCELEQQLKDAAFKLNYST